MKSVNVNLDALCLVAGDCEELTDALADHRGEGFERLVLDWFPEVGDDPELDPVVFHQSNSLKAASVE